MDPLRPAFVRCPTDEERSSMPNVSDLGPKREGPSSDESMSTRKDNVSESSTSEFVKKLYMMLEDRSHENLICWRPQGDSFVVKNVNEFTATILPRVFKHSNFASFVRQLNKYDFHKIKSPDNPLDEQSWVFKHPDFRADRRDMLENIKRKAQRKSIVPTAAAAERQPSTSNLVSTSHQLEIQNNRISSLETQLKSVSAAHDDALSSLRTLERSHQEVILELVSFQQSMAQQDALLGSLLQYLWRDGGAGKMLPTSDGLDGLNSQCLFLESKETQRMLDQSLSASDVARTTLLQMNELSGQAEGRGIYVDGGNGSSNAPLAGCDISPELDDMNMVSRIEELQEQPFGEFIPPLDPSSVSAPGNAEDLDDELVLPTPTSAPTLGTDGIAPLSSCLSAADASNPLTWDAHEGLEVYTVGHLMPRGKSNSGTVSFDSGAVTGSQKLRVRRSTFVPGWAVPPRVLLVDDDAVTRKLSSKFLQIFGCTIDVAVDGVGAVNKMNLEKYDLVLMDIVMPKLDGISATSMIRKFDPQTPIISMTSSSRPTEIMTYYSSGMNDILPKPFTRDGLLGVLEKHLAHLTLIRQQISTTSPQPSVSSESPPLFNNTPMVSSPDSDLGYGPTSPNTAADDRRNIFAGMGIADEDYDRLFADIFSADTAVSSSGSAKRPLELGLDAEDSEQAEQRVGKRRRFQHIC
ncbi:HSF-type DNA-binding-domain-containing protein [Mycena haematopus]|nr:HSF-type DNA-binding-domain-containing protein [Mycena haematopus]